MFCSELYWVAGEPGSDQPREHGLPCQADTTELNKPEQKLTLLKIHKFKNVFVWLYKVSALFSSNFNPFGYGWFSDPYFKVL